MRVLADRHHADLAHSLRLLLEDRFGWTLYFPRGMEWFTEGIWQHEREWHGDAVARQYLEGIWANVTEFPDHSEAPDLTHPGRVHRGLTLEQARDLRPDIVIATLPENERGLHRLAREIGATYGVQIGNQWQTTDWVAADFGLVSATVVIPIPKPHVIYHQEFELGEYRQGPHEGRAVASFVQCFADNDRSYAEFLSYARELPEFDWKVYGAYGQHPPDEFAAGNLSPSKAVADAMRETRIGWHTKQWSDGFGHVIHSLFATGTPVVGRASYYRDKLAGPLWVDGVTSFDVDTRSRDEVIAILRRLRDDDDFHGAISENAARKFREVVSFDEDAEKIRAMFDGVLSVAA